MGLVFRGMLRCYCFTDFVKSLYCYCQNGGKTAKTLRVLTDKQNHPTFPCRPPNLLSLGQTDSQVVASGGKLNLGRDLRCMAKRTGKIPHKYTQVANKPNSRKTFSIFHWLMIG